VIAVDTNILARYYVDDPGDAEAAGQRRRAERVMRDSEHVFVPMTVVLELTWVLRSFYEFSATDCARVIEHLVGLPNVTVEAWPKVLEATRLLRAGLDFADALHLACSGGCEAFLTFDDRRFAKRAQKLGCTPAVQTPA
jgi:predicted nucleic-acid-binding protein